MIILVFRCSLGQFVRHIQLGVMSKRQLHVITELKQKRSYYCSIEKVNKSG